MATHKVVDTNLKDVGTVDLSDKMFGQEVNPGLIHEAIRMYRANQRVGTASTKTRSEVKGSNVKPYRQKGTGRARHGSWTSPLFVGGGITFGPKPRDYSYEMPKKKRRVALANALSMKVKEGEVIVVDKWVEQKKTKDMAAVLKKMKIANALIVVEDKIEWLERTTRNIPHIRVTNANLLTTYDLLKYKNIIFTKNAVNKIGEGY